MAGRKSHTSRTIFLLIAICLLSVPAYAKYSGGTGEPNNPYQIATAEDLIALGETPEDYDKHFILTADIDLNPNLPGRKVFDRAVIAPDTDPTKEYFQGSPFTGVFDGNSHTISNLTITGNSYIGLFGELRYEAKVKNLGLLHVQVSGARLYAGGLVGSSGGAMTQCYSTGVVSGDSSVGGLVGCSGGTVTQCHSAGAVSGTGESVGGLVGYSNGSIATSYSTGTVTGGSGVGGLVGSNIGEVIDCYSRSAASGDGSVGGLVGVNVEFGLNRPSGMEYYYGFVNRCYSTGAVSGSKDVGGLVGWNTDDRGSEGIVWQSFWDTQTSGQTTSAAGTDKTTAEMQTAKTFLDAGWDFVGQPDGPHDIWAEPMGGGYPILSWQLPAGFGLPVFSGGTGEAGGPYHISTPAELNSIAGNPRLMGAHFELANDIDLRGINFYIIGSELYPFMGSFNGNGHTVSHLTIAGWSYLGLFGVLESGAAVSDLGVVDVNITGGLGTRHYAGGLVGKNVGGHMTRCYSTGAVSGVSRVGGLVGGNYDGGDLAGCFSTCAVSGIWYVGGLVGANYEGAVTDCYATGTVSGDSTVGGLVGDNYGGAVTQCYSTGAVIGTGNAGGLVGSNINWLGDEGVVSQSFWDIQTSGQATSDGGTGKTTAEMQTASTFLEAGWDFVGETANGTDDLWWILEGKDYPRLWWEAQ